MTTPRDTIGLSDRLRTPIWNENTMKQWDSWREMITKTCGSLPRDCFESFLDGIDEERVEAATALDALQARVKELEAEQAAIVRDYQRMNSQLADEMKHATRAEQERDEALERAAKHFEESEHLVWSNDEAADAIRRLAGRVKGGNDET